MLEWTVSAQEAFQNAKCLLAAAVHLQHPAPNAELSLATDASDTLIGRVMQQKSGNHWWPLSFFSQKLTDTESRYSTFDRELLAAHAAIKHFCHFCKGWAFQLWTDHKPLFTAISRASAPISPRQQCHLAFISEFNVQMLYLPGLKNVVADFLSRPNQATTGSVAAASPVDTCLHPYWPSNHLGCTLPPLYSTCIWAAIYQTIKQCCRTSCCAYFHTERLCLLKIFSNFFQALN